MRFGRCTSGLENIALVILQWFQPGSNIALMLPPSSDPQIRHQVRASRLGDQLLKSLTRTAKLPFHFTIQAAFAPVQ